MLCKEYTRIGVLTLLKNLGFNADIKYKTRIFEMNQECEIIDKLLQKSEHIKKIL